MKQSHKMAISTVVTIVALLLLFTECFASSIVVVTDGANPASPSSVTTDTKVIAIALDAISSRSGPSTQYSSLGTYNIKQQKTTLISQCTDNGGVCWLQCEVRGTGGGLRRVYALHDRFDPATFKLKDIPQETPLYEAATLNQTVTPKYGPGSDYLSYDPSFLTLVQATKVAIITYENNYAQIEFNATNTENGITSFYRVWVDRNTLD